MLIVCIGDSLTEGDYGVYKKRCIPNVKEENYPYFLAKYLNCETRNYGKCGYRSSDSLQYYRDGNIDLTGADAIVIMLGTNGGQSATEETYDNECYRQLIDLCEQDAPDSRLVLCTPPHATVDPKYSNCGYAEQVEQAVLFVHKLAEEKGIALIDVARCPYFTAETESIMQPNDGLHFSKAGYELLAKFIGDNLKEILSV